jgi:hypothetical protein
LNSTKSTLVKFTCSLHIHGRHFHNCPVTLWIIVIFPLPPPALFQNSSFSFTALLTRMSWSCQRDTQVFGVQCAAYIHPSRYYGIPVLWYGIMVRSEGFSPAFSRLPSSCMYGATAP